MKIRKAKRVTLRYQKVIREGDRELIQLYVLNRGYKLVIIEANYFRILEEISGLYYKLAAELPKLMSNTSKDDALEEVQRILKDSGKKKE